MLSQNNARGKEKHGRMTSPKPVIKVVSRRSWWSAVSSKSNSEMCLCSWQLSHTEVVGGPSEYSVRCMMGIKTQSDWGVNKRSVSRGYECRFFFHECSLWIHGSRGVYNLKRLQFPGRELRLSCRKWQLQRWMARGILSGVSEKKAHVRPPSCITYSLITFFTITVSHLT